MKHQITTISALSAGRDVLVGLVVVVVVIVLGAP